MMMEVMGRRFDQPSDEKFFSLRFPPFIKVPEHRLAQGAISSSEYQCLARKSFKNVGERDHTMIEVCQLSVCSNAILIQNTVSTKATRYPPNPQSAMAPDSSRHRIPRFSTAEGNAHTQSRRGVLLFETRA